MGTRGRLRMTEADYLAYDLAHEGKHELVNGEIVAMAGASLAHSTIQMNLAARLGVALRGGPCRAHGSDLRVSLDETGMYAYPDLSVVCGEPELSPTTPASLKNPTVIVEVLSESTEAYDLGPKAAHYRHRASVNAILFVDSRRRWTQLQTRNPDGTWTLADQEAGSVRIGAIGVELEFDELYEGVTNYAT